MLELLRRHKRIVLALALPYIALLFLMTYRIDYRIYTPGGLNPVENFIEFETQSQQEHPFQTIYIMNVEKPTFFQFMVSYFDGAHTTNPLPVSRTEVSDRANFQSGQVARNTSVDLALINAYEALDYTIEYDTEYIVSLYYEYMDNKDLDIGDVILSVNGDADVLSAFSEVGCNETAILKVRKSDGSQATYDVTKQTREDSCAFGLSVSTYYRITDTEIPYTVKDSIIGGPSGGLMQALHIYNVLSDDDLTEGRIVAGTGTIRIDGSVGSIGGVREKVWTAHKENVDVFFVPEANHDAAKAAQREIGESTMAIVSVASFENALDYLKGEDGDG